MKLDTHVYRPKKIPKAKIPDLIKEEIIGQGRKLVEELRVEHIKPPPEDTNFSYITDIYLKWHGSSLYFCAQYCCRAPNCISPSFERKFASMEYAGNRCFNLSYMRHTEKWQELYPGMSAAECLESIRTEPHFLP